MENFDQVIMKPKVNRHTETRPLTPAENTTRKEKKKEERLMTRLPPVLVVGVQPTSPFSISKKIMWHSFWLSPDDEGVSRNV